MQSAVRKMMFWAGKKATANSFKVKGCRLSRNPASLRLSEEKLTEGKLILWNNLVGSLWTSTLSSSAYAWWFKRLSPLLTGEPAFLIAKHYGPAPCFGLQFEFLVYRGCEGPLFWDKRADRPMQLKATELKYACKLVSRQWVMVDGIILLVPHRYTDYNRYLHLICSLKYAGATEHLPDNRDKLFI